MQWIYLMVLGWWACHVLWPMSPPSMMSRKESRAFWAAERTRQKAAAAMEESAVERATRRRVALLCYSLVALLAVLAMVSNYFQYGAVVPPRP